MPPSAERFTDPDGLTSALRLGLLPGEWVLWRGHPFGQPAMIQALIKHSSGVTGRVTWLVGRAAERSIEDGSERIAETDIERVSERLRIAAV